MKFIREYLRPIRTIIWVIIITILFIKLITGFEPRVGQVDLLSLLILAMFTDMGVYGLSRTYEKINTKNIITDNKEESIDSEVK